MRRFIFILLVVLLTTSFAFATSKPSLDGRAVVAEEGVLPAGLFAKTVGYLPGDSVSVTNPATGITINVLILGSIDPSAGVAILLSPEAADKLFITPDSNTQVKITKRTGMLDESVSGSGTVVSNTPADTLPSSLTDNLDAKLDTVDEALGTPADDVPPEATEIPAETNDVEVALVPPATEPVAEAKDEASEYAITSVEEIPQENLASANDPVYIVESLDEEVEEPIEEPEPVEEPVVEPVVEPVAEPEPEMEPKEEDPTLVDPFAPIILIPTEENPPEEDETKADPVKPVPPADSKIEPVPVAPPAESAIAKTTPSGLGTSQKNMVKSLSELERGKYYVQVATFAQQENIDKMLKDYGSKYPFVMVPLKSGNAMQMMVGPLNVDEYGAVLERFKNLGFEDSFLRKIR